MAAIMEEPISHIKGWFNGRIVITVVRSYYQILRGDWVPSPLQTRDLDWDSGSGFDLEQ